MQEEPLVRAYTACILANIAFLEPGQQTVLRAGGVAPLVKLLKSSDDKKVTLHSTAAIQNLTYKNTLCCQAVLEQGGERALKKLLQHKSGDVKQFAAGALANLQLYRRSQDSESAMQAQTESSSSAMPSIGSSKVEKSAKSVSRKVAKILRRRSNDISQGDKLRREGAATTIQARFRGLQGRRKFERKRAQSLKKGNRYDVFRVNDVRAEMAVLPPLGHKDGILSKRGSADLGGFGSALSSGAYHSGRRPQRLAPLDSDIRNAQATKLPSITDPHNRMSSMLPPMPPAGAGLRPMGVRC